MATESSQLLYTKLTQKVSTIYQSNRILVSAAALIATLTATLGIRKLIDVWYRKLRSYPPGPCGIPFFGCLLWIRDKQYLQSLANAYGSVVMIQVGTKYLTMINDHNISKVLFKKKEFAFHKKNPPTQYKSFVETNGKTYTFRRKLIHQSFIMMLSSDYLNNFGIKMLNDHIYPKFDEFASNKNEYYSVKKIFEYGVFCMNFVCIFGDYLTPPDMHSFEYTLIAHTVSRKSLSLSLLFNEIPNIITNRLSHLNKETHNLTFMQSILQKWVTEFQQKYKDRNVNDGLTNINNEPYAVRMMKQIELLKTLTINDMIGDIGILFGTGVGTVNKALSRMIIYAAKCANIQDEIYNELNVFQKKYGSFKLQHLSELHLLRAFIYETLRNGHIVWAVPRIIYDDNICVNKYNIPKYSLISSYYGYMDHDNKNWKYPNIFDIRNFLDENNKFKSNEHSCVFGHGIRSCPGKALANRMLILFIGMILLRYKLSIKDDSSGKDTIDYFSSDTLSVYDTKIMVQHR
eukprot:526801_1